MDSGNIHISAIKESKSVLIKIKDDGPGMSEDLQIHLFDPFVTEGKKNGTGLGTAIAKSLIESHGGEINFVSDSKTGTEFFIRLPDHA